jgi:hypothetical protein
MWFAELGTSVFKTTLQDRVFEFTVGWFGVNRLEKLAIGYFKHSDERESIHKIPTLDVAFDVDLIIPDDLDPRIPHKADPLVEPLVIRAHMLRSSISSKRTEIVSISYAEERRSGTKGEVSSSKHPLTPNSERTSFTP